MIKWTDKQQEAIGLRDKNMLVAAAAGSGKTAVLVERIKQLIIKDRVGIDRLLIVTFTNAAASEMKEKITAAITQEIEMNPKESQFLRKQLNLMANVNISTFHAFALEVMRRYFYLTDLEPNFKIGDEGTISMMKGEIMDELFSQRFDSGDEGFITFLKAYSSDRNDRMLKENLQSLYQTIQSIPNPIAWMEEKIAMLDIEGEDFTRHEWLPLVRSDVKESYAEIREDFQMALEISEYAGTPSIARKIREDLDGLAHLKPEDLDEFGRQLALFKPARMTPTKEDKEAFGEVKDEIGRHRDLGKRRIKALMDRYFFQPIEAFGEDIRQVYPMGKYLFDLINSFDLMFKEAKKQENLVDFNDIEHYALKIFEHKEAAAEYREKFLYIFVDEYQDSNVLQDQLIHRIKRENNLFMVGDIKQSIYKFRLAEPEIFREKYDTYKCDQNAGSTKLDLNQNFRSKAAVIATVNGVFSQIMDGYDQNAALYQGADYHGPLDYTTQLHVVDNRVIEGMELDDEIADMKNAELEAFAAAQIIKEALGNPIYDAKKQIERPLKKRDIVILMRGVKNYASIFQQVFTELDVPAYMDDNTGYFDTVEIEVFLNLLRVIDNRQQDLPLLSIMRSSIAEFSIEELIEIRTSDRKAAFHEALAGYCYDGRDLGLSQKCSALYRLVDQWWQMSRILPLEDTLWKLMWDTGYYTYCGALPAGDQRQANLRALVDKARDFQQNSYSGIYGFLQYIQALETRKTPIGQVKLTNENDDIVRIMTIHKSKGLEFPMVIVAGLGRPFNLRKTGKGFSAHKDIGIGLTRVNYHEHWYRKTLVQTIIEQKMKREDTAEELRVLYVAFTRAMDRLVLLGTSRGVENGMIKMGKGKNCYLDYLSQVIAEGHMDLYIHDRSEINMDVCDRSKKKGELLELFEQRVLDYPELSEEIHRRLSFVYPNARALTMKSKYAVTELIGNERPFEPTERLKLPVFDQEEKLLTGAEKGTILHRIMEWIDFQAIFRAYDKLAYVKEQVAQMISRELLTHQEVASIDLGKVVRFFNTELGIRAGAADQVYKETEFNMLQMLDDTEVMVQGIIDCYFEEKDGLVLIDYKSNYVDLKNKEYAIDEIKTYYMGQIQIYKDALKAAGKKPVKAAYLYLFSIDEPVKM